MYGTTYFELLMKNPELFNNIRDQISDQNFDDYEDEEGIEHDHLFIRRLIAALKTPLKLDENSDRL